MTYIDSAGVIRQGSKPMSKNPVDLLSALFWGLINFLWAFVASMCNVSARSPQRVGRSRGSGDGTRATRSQRASPRTARCCDPAGAPDQVGVVGRRDQAL